MIKKYLSNMRNISNLGTLCIVFLAALITGCAQRKLEADLNIDPSSGLNQESDVLVGDKPNEHSFKMQEDSGSNQKSLEPEKQEEKNVEKTPKTPPVPLHPRGGATSSEQGKTPQPNQPKPLDSSPVLQNIPLPNVDLSTFPPPPINDLPSITDMGVPLPPPLMDGVSLLPPIDIDIDDLPPPPTD